MNPLTLRDAMELFVDHRRGRTLETRRQYRYWLETWHAWRIVHARPPLLDDVAIADIRDYLRYLETEHVPERGPRGRVGLMPATVAAARRTLKALWRFLDGEELLTPAQARFFSNNRIPAPVVIEEPRPYCDAETFQTLLAAAGDGHDEDSARNRAILYLLYESGMRIGEVCGLMDEQVHLKQRWAHAFGKGQKWRPVFWSPSGGVALIRYVLIRRGPRDSGPLFRGTSPRNNGGAMTPDATRQIIKRLAVDGGVVLPPGCPIHWLRHSFAKRCLDAGVDEIRLAQLMGHASIEQSRRYASEHPQRLKAIYDDLFGVTAPPDRRAREGSA